MPERKVLIKLLAALRLLQKREIPATDLGICGNLICYFEFYDGEYEPVMDEALEQCEWYTGDECYPIPGCGYSDPSDAYHKTDNKWATETFSTRSYALRRYELVDRMIDVCIKHIDSPSSKLSVLK
jgi:hypothetical protein